MIYKDKIIKRTINKYLYEFNMVRKNKETYKNNEKYYKCR